MLHLGDYDPSGVSIFERVVEDVQAFAEQDAPEYVLRRRAGGANRAADR